MTLTNQSEEPSFEAFSAQLHGEVLHPGDEGYQEARTVWNGLIDTYPAAIARCTGAADVITAVDFAREYDLPLAVKGGGHNVAGTAVCDDNGLVIDLAQMNGVRVDPRAQTVRVQGGATWDQVNHETLQFGLVPPGIPESVGVGGFTLGGGMGVVMRKYGLASDNLRDVDVVTADGDLITASENDREELFWALRGGGGNFGIVTSFEFECFEDGADCLTAQALYPMDAAEGVLRFFRKAMEEVPDALAPMVSFVSIPELRTIPEEYHGDPGVSLYVMGIGDPDALDSPLRRLLAFDEQLMQVVEVRDYTDLFEPFDAPPKGERHHWKSVYLDEISDGLIATLVDGITPLPTPSTGVSIYSLGGAVSRYEPDATAYSHRDASYLVHITTQWTDPEDDEANTAWTRDLHEAIVPHGTGGEYINNQTDDDPERVRAAYGDNYDRLVKIKNDWDPENLFRMNQNINPDV